MYRFPAEFVGSALCWRGEVLWEGAAGQFVPIRTQRWRAARLTGEDAGRRIFGVAIKQEPPLAMRLEPTSSTVRVWQLAAIGAPARRRCRGRCSGSLRPHAASHRSCRSRFIAITLVVAFLNDASFIGGVRPFDSGDDGLVYDGYARVMLQHLLAGDIAGALEGCESVFYFTPGMRYLRAVEHVIFGESYLGYLSP